MLTVLQVAYAFAPVTADPAGGSEQVLAALDRALTAQGHRSLVVAQQGSAVTGTLYPTPAPGPTIEEGDWAPAHAAMRDRIATVMETERPDLIHLHGLDWPAYLPPPGPPVLVTLHLPLSWYPPAALRTARPRTWLQPVSASQAALGEPDIRLCPPIANGVDTALYRPRAKHDRALVLGRITQEKGFHDAIEAAGAADVPLDIAGKVFPYRDHRRYFAEQVEPRLGERCRYLGPVEGATKRRLLAEARCVLIPSTAAETSSLVAMEALSSGTPVVAYRAGALPTIVDHGTTGFIVDHADGMADAIRRIDAIDPAACRAAALARYDQRAMTRAYFDIYRQIAA